MHHRWRLLVTHANSPPSFSPRHVTPAWAASLTTQIWYPGQLANRYDCTMESQQQLMCRRTQVCCQ